MRKEPPVSELEVVLAINGVPEATVPKVRVPPTALILTLNVAVKVEVLLVKESLLWGTPLVVIDLETKLISGPTFLTVMVLPTAEPVSVIDEPAEFSEVTFVATALVEPMSAAKVSAVSWAESTSIFTVRVLVVSAGMIQSISEKVALIAVKLVPTTEAEPIAVLPS